MSKAVFTTRPDSPYDDLPEERYHFPRRYLRAVRDALDDWIVYYEPRRGGGRLSYIATARLIDIEADLDRSDHYYAFVQDYLEFDRPVPFREGRSYYESSLQKLDGSPNRGGFGWAVRPLQDAEYRVILAAGFQNIEGVGEHLPAVYEQASRDEGEPQEADRRVIQQICYRPFRNRVFSAAVKKAYDNTCAISGLRIINGGGRSEAQAAHIRPVAQNGPDSMRNGLALSATVHWMFDRGLVSISDDYKLLLNEESIPDNVRGLINQDQRLRLPVQQLHHPHRRFLKHHREHVFTGRSA